MKRQTFMLGLGIFLGYALVHILKVLNQSVLWVLFYR